MPSVPAAAKLVIFNAACLLLNVVQSPALKYPLVAADDCEIEIVGVVPPLEEIGAFAPTLVIVPLPLLLKVVQSPLLK